ncbi:hypothetical protein AVEN_75293-1 [Araneus ventricosus]|uniref:Uncharacterized protein n=1 Tax=Araneus ventricosus TaxID=182803 RepID=A0A4Y2S6L3_ARAVE|nr:hypothetical protein AVEN_75293-1 [Araneus ventricosus]
MINLSSSKETLLSKLKPLLSTISSAMGSLEGRNRTAKLWMQYFQLKAGAGLSKRDTLSLSHPMYPRRQTTYRISFVVGAKETAPKIVSAQSGLTFRLKPLPR